MGIPSWRMITRCSAQKNEIFFLRYQRFLWIWMNPTKQSLLYPEIAQRCLGEDIPNNMVTSSGWLQTDSKAGLRSSNWWYMTLGFSPKLVNGSIMGYLSNCFNPYTNSPNKLRAIPRRYPNSAKMNLSQASSVVVQRVVFFGVAWCMGTRILSLLPPYPMLRPRKHDS